MRLFIALQPSATFLTGLKDIQDQLRSAGVGGRYLAPDNLHLTLAFIGEWPVDITAMMPCIEEPFSLVLSDIGIFSRAKVLWAGVKPSEPLNALAAQIRQNLHNASIPYDPQPFNPHITLIRKPSLPGDTLPEIKVSPVSMTVKEVCLYQSEHTENGMRYTVIGRRQRTREVEKSC